MTADFQPPRGLHLFAKIVVVATFLLIGAGGLVTSTGSGLSVPDWPTTYGYNMFTFPVSRWVGGILFEHGHRLIASTVGMLTVVLAIWITIVEKRVWMKVLGWVALLAVILQGILGGLTVRYLLPVSVSVSHACLAKLFFCITIAIAFLTSPSWFEKTDTTRVQARGPRTLPYLAMGTTLVIYFQVFLGAIMRHTYDPEIGFIIPDFPLSNGGWIPDFTSLLVGIHFLHRVSALLILFLAVSLVLWISKRLDGPSRLLKPAILLMGLVLLQGALGVLTLWTEVEDPVSGYFSRVVPVASLHQWNGALVLGVSFYLSLRAFQVTSPGTVPESIPEKGSESGYALQV